MKRNSPALGVNIDHVATIRQARLTKYPDPISIMFEAIEGGADQVTIHLREDRRHIQDDDLYYIAKKSTVPVNLEMAPIMEIAQIARLTKPNTVTLVPERRAELTTECGLDIKRNPDRIAEVMNYLKSSEINISLFINPDPDDIHHAKSLGADAVELHTGFYVDADEASRSEELDKLIQSSTIAKKLGLKLCAGHGLHYENVRELTKKIPEIEEYNIGHAIVARSLFVGFKNAVNEMKTLLGGHL